MLAFEISRTVVAVAAPPVTAHTVSPTAMSLACLRVVQHAAPVGKWCVGVRVSVALAAVVRVRKVACARVRRPGGDGYYRSTLKAF